MRGAGLPRLVTSRSLPRISNLRAHGIKIPTSSHLLCPPASGGTTLPGRRYAHIASPLGATVPTEEPLESAIQTNNYPNAGPLLDDKSLSLGMLLDHYDLTSPIPSDHLLPLLKHQSRPSDIIIIMPSIIDYVEETEIPIDHIVDLIQQLLIHLGRHQMFALLPSVVQLFLQRMEVEIDVTVQLDVDILQAKYKGFIQHLRYFSTLGPSRATQPLPLPVRDQISRIVAHLLKTLSKLPSSSKVDSQPQLSPSFLKYIFRRRFLTPELRRMLVGYSFSRKIELSIFQWQQCTLSAMEEGDDKAARKYRIRWKLAIDKANAEATSKANEENEKEEEVDEDELLEKAQIVNEEPIKSTIEMCTPTTSISERDKQISKIISEMVLSQYSKSLDKILPTMEPYIDPRSLSNLDAHLKKSTGPGLKNNLRGTKFRPARYDVHSLLRYAWSILLDRCSKDQSVTAEALLEMAETLPGDAVVGHTLTPIMYGLIKRGEPLKAWGIWRDLIEREKSAPPLAKGLFVDRITLAVATEACQAALNIETALVLVDTWAKRPTAIRKKKDNSWAGSIPLDAQNINILLNLCRLDRKPSLAFRLWSAALPRYGVHLDDISLNLLLDIARYSEDDLEDEVALSHQEENELFRRRLRAIAQEFQFRRKGRESNDNDEEEGDGWLVTEDENNRIYNDEAWANSSTSILLDNPNTAWRYRLDKGGMEAPWKKARRVFRQVVLGNWPHLRDVQSPLELAHRGAFASILSFFSSTNTHTHASGPKQEQVDGEIHLPAPNARFTHIIPTSNTFRSYIALLGYYNRHSEIPIVLAWMKSLDIRPTWSTMCLALLHICESEGPRRWIKGFGEDGKGLRLVRDEDIMRKWLQDWLEGEISKTKGNTNMSYNVVPTEQDVANSRRWLAERRQRLTA
ncbi:hypothetical protein I203_101992 [Kwoniella mangroviensis CBS 8507]|uniref:uncharacterized protein n=1 Tax=Kwoniella mangroviensis CBS 8507 TaxID=1296122 RepID=UPI00080D3116|nr:uncharacterized protein I203_03188 [Kwoniella mangroviensis CBS 8507]OCF67491.1 hypothetical protein I203_03188 [Kwoniella mangroviensis CBS 8507]